MAVTRGIVLSTQAFGEADRYVQFLTRDWGVVSLLAKSARKSQRRYVGGLDLFCHDEISVRGDARERGYLVELTVLNSFTRLRDSLDKILVAGKFVQSIRKFSNVAISIPKIYSLLGQCLAILEAEADETCLEWLRLFFQLKLLFHLGLYPRTDICARCGSDELSFVFDIPAGGLLCAQCRPSNEHFLLSPIESDFIRKVRPTPLARWAEQKHPAVATQQLDCLLTSFSRHHS
jgi:DNA repair protein RecO (recombination protein O)